MKTNFLNLRFTLSSLSLSLLITGLLVFSACGSEDENPTCSGCTAASPWSKAGASSCYATQTDCERAEGGTCTICN